MNKYLVKIAEKKKEGYGGDAIVGGVGVGLAKRQYDHGHLTGRTTYYHGSTKGVTDRIKEEGIVPRKSTGIIDKMDMDGSFKKVNENLAFATKTKLQAHFYAAQAKHLHNAKAGDVKSVKATQNRALSEGIGNHIKDSLGIKKDKGVTKLHVPTWKHEVKSNTVRNPELDNLHLDSSLRHELHHNTLTHKGTLPPKFVQGSRHYEKNSVKEVKEYIKHNGSRFAKGLGKAGLGVALTGIAARSAYQKLKKKD